MYKPEKPIVENSRAIHFTASWLNIRRVAEVLANGRV